MSEEIGGQFGNAVEINQKRGIKFEQFRECIPILFTTAKKRDILATAVYQFGAIGMRREETLAIPGEEVMREQRGQPLSRSVVIDKKEEQNT